MVGTVGRTDLLGDEHREALAHELYRALRDRILTLPDDLPVYPTHGAGSFCSAPGGGDRTTTIGRERATNPLLSMDEDDFVAHLLAGLGSFPDYFRRLPAVNQHGLPLHDDVPALTPLDRRRRSTVCSPTGRSIVDARKVIDFAAGHIPGSLSIELRPVFASWLGWLTEPDQPVVFVLDDDQDEADLVRQALTIGHDNLAGRLTGGVDAWMRGRSAGRHHRADRTRRHRPAGARHPPGQRVRRRPRPRRASTSSSARCDRRHGCPTDRWPRCAARPNEP